MSMNNHVMDLNGMDHQTEELGIVTTELPDPHITMSTLNNNQVSNGQALSSNMDSDNISLEPELDDNLAQSGLDHVIGQEESPSEVDGSDCPETEFEETDEGIASEEEARKNAAKPQKLQFSVIHIDCGRVDKAIKKDPNYVPSARPLTNTDRVEFIVNYYNDKHSEQIKIKRSPRKVPKLDPFQRKLDFSSSPSKTVNDMEIDDDILPSSPSETSSSTTSPMPVRSTRTKKKRNEYIPRKYFGDFCSEDFDLKIYSQRNEDMDPETGEVFTTLSKIRFLVHKTKYEIFALPSGFSRYVVQNWADTTFPLSIASAILMENSTGAKTIKSLVANRYFSKFRMRSKESLMNDSRFSPQIITSFTATVKNDQIKNILQVNPTSELKLKTGFDSIKFTAGTNITNYATLCSALSEIHNNKNLERSREYRGYFTQVNSNISSYLDYCVLHELHELIFYNDLTQDVNDIRKQSKLKGFQIFQKNFEKYVKAEKYCVTYAGKKSIEHNYMPSFEELCEDIKRTLLIRLSLPSSKSGQLKILDELKLSCKFTNQKNYNSENFMKCLEGVYYDETENKNFWKMTGNWYHVQNSYIYDVEFRFQDFLSKHLIIPKSDELRPSKMYLYKPITFKGNSTMIGEGEYNKLYKGVHNYIVGDDVDVLDGVELFDIMQYSPVVDTDNNDSPSPLIFYHGKKQFDAKHTRVVGNQLHTAATLIFNSLHGNLDRSALKLIHDKYSKDECEFNFIKANFEKDFKKFQQATENATFVFAIIHSCRYLSLKATYCFNLTTSPNEFKNILGQLSSEDRHEFDEVVIESTTGQLDIDLDEKLALTIFNLMKEDGYIDYEQNFTQKWFDCRAPNKTKLYLEQFIVPSKFKLNGLKTNDERNRDKVENNISKLFINGIRELNVNGNLNSKMIILSLWEELMDMRFKFKIVEVPVAPNRRDKIPPTIPPTLS